LKTNPDLLALKCVILGYQFSGKKSIAECLHKKYGVEVLTIENLIKDLMDKLQFAKDEEDDVDL